MAQALADEYSMEVGGILLGSVEEAELIVGRMLRA